MKITPLGATRTTEALWQAYVTLLRLSPEIRVLLDHGLLSHLRDTIALALTVDGEVIQHRGEGIAQALGEL